MPTRVTERVSASQEARTATIVGAVEKPVLWSNRRTTYGANTIEFKPIDISGIRQFEYADLYVGIWEDNGEPPRLLGGKTMRKYWGVPLPFTTLLTVGGGTVFRLYTKVALYGPALPGSTVQGTVSYGGWATWEGDLRYTKA